MALTVLSLSRTGIDTAIVSANNGQIQSKDAYTFEHVDPTSPNSDSLLPTFESHAKKHAGLEVAVFALSTQLVAGTKYDILNKATSAGFATRVATVDYIDAYLAALKVEDLAPDAILLFIEITTATACAQLFKVRSEGGERVRVPLYVEGLNFSAPVEDFVARLSKWAETHQSPAQVVIFNPSDAIQNILQTKFQPTSAIISVTGVDITRCAAAYAFTNVQQLREEEDDMGTYMSPAPISVVLADGTAATIIYRSALLPAGRNVTFTTVEDNQTSVVAEIVLGNHTARPEDKYVFAEIILDGLRPRPKGETIITVSVSLSEGWGNSIEVFEGTEKTKETRKTLVQIPDPYQSPSYRAAEPFSCNPANEITLGKLPAS
ncbi:hypothetical protein CPB84DRAFT_1760790 [Gymnopilus junonius]|uniref:Uncharacterized protein n=1 Tax=Gymnopilus junonius TaxID=109634 RepID=A0A9P5TUT9_GYMJU|nr:hypothetical protein CPB84DRAFT_1760790 [Gymnopilus junonius]